MTSEPAGLPSSAPLLVTRTTAVDDPGSLTALLPDGRRPADLMSWLREGEGMVGWGRAAAVRTTGADRFGDASAWWREVADRAVVRDDVGLPGTGPVAFGAFAFRSTSASGASLVVPEVVVGRRDGVAWVTTVSAAGDLPPLPEIHTRPPARRPERVVEQDGALSGAQWADAVRATVDHIQSGAADKVVLARDVRVRTGADLDVRWLLERLADEYANTWTFSVDGLVGATPELLVRREKGLVHSRILAGTIRRTGDDERDLALAAGLARSSKDLEEHEYAVRSVADALSPHCRSMNVPEAPFVLHLPNVMHLATDVAGVLADESSSLTLAESLHPSAAVCGTPTREAADVIDRLERMDRGRYAGPVGWMDANGDGEWGIALRCGQIDAEKPSEITLFAGCGIVSGSDPAAELAESEAKLLPMRHALGG